MIPQRDEDYRLYASIKGDGFSIDNVLCKVYLPERLSDPIKVYFTSSVKQPLPMGCPFEFSFLSESTDERGKSILRVQASMVYIDEHSSKSWGSGPSEVILVGSPIDLKIIQSLKSNAELEGKEAKVRGSFWMTPSIMLAPQKILERSYTGDVKVTTVSKYEFELQDNIRLSFDYHYRFAKTRENADSISFPELVAEFEFESEVVVNEALPLLDDFLTLTSFADRQRCVCLGWDYSSDNTYTRFYRRCMSFPKNDTKHDFNDTLIDPPKFKEFMTTVYKMFAAVDCKEALRQAMQRVLYRVKYCSNDVFLTLYSGVETLVFMDHEGFILPPEQWSILREDLQTYVKEHHLLEGKERRNDRQAIYEKMPELNRISFSSALKTFSTTYKVDLSDLWPLVDRTDGIPLSEIRNRLIHGDVFSLHQERAMASACIHLRLILERMILSVLGWPVSESRASFYNVERLVEWRDDRKKF
jgi:hypothetical protein